MIPRIILYPNLTSKSLHLNFYLWMVFVLTVSEEYVLNPFYHSLIVPFNSVAQLYLNLCDPMECSTPGLPVLHHLAEFAQTHVHWISNVIQPSCLLLTPSPPAIFPSIRVFSNESALHIRWPKYWSFSNSPSNEYSRLISFRMDWLDPLASFLQHHNSKE